MLQSMGSQRVGHNLETEQQQQQPKQEKKFEKDKIKMCITESLCCNLKLTQHYESTILQYKIKLKSKTAIHKR